MGLGSTAKTVQRLADLAETLYEQVNEVLERLGALQEHVEGASDDVAAVRTEQRRQRALIEALAAEQGVDVEAVLAEVQAEGIDEGKRANDGDDAGGPGGPARSDSAPGDQETPPDAT